MIMRHAVTAEDIGRFPRLRAIVRMGVGYDKIDRAAAAARNILVCNVPDYGTTEVADHAMALALALRRGVRVLSRAAAPNPPAPWGAVKNDLIRRLGVQTFGIVGLGRIGTAVALRARAFGFRVMFYDPVSAERRRPRSRHWPRRHARRPAAADRHLVGPRPADPGNPPDAGPRPAIACCARVRSWLTPRAGRSSTSTRCWRCCATATSPAPGSTCCRSSRRSTRSPNPARLSRPRARPRRTAGNHPARRLVHPGIGARYPGQIGRDDARGAADQPPAERDHAGNVLASGVRYFFGADNVTPCRFI